MENMRALKRGGQYCLTGNPNKTSCTNSYCKNNKIVAKLSVKLLCHPKDLSLKQNAKLVWHKLIAKAGVTSYM